MKTLFQLLSFLGFSFCLWATPFSYQFFNADGTAQTNPMTMTAWPRDVNAWTVYGTNIVYGGRDITLTPNTNGYGTNFAYPNNYRIYVSNLGASFYLTLPDTTNQIPLGMCLTNAPQVAGPLGFFALVTNWLGYMPATNNAAGIKFALGYTPASNSYAGITNALGYNPQNATYAALTNTAGFVFATNGLAALTNTLTDAALVGIHAYRPATNGLAALTNTLTDAALVGIHAYRPATNGGSILATQLPQLGNVGVTNLNSTLLTNLGTGTVLIWTNLAIGTAPTMGAPDGSLLVATNGNAYIRSNATWINLK